jgi:hypothetical protein
MSLSSPFSSGKLGLVRTPIEAAALCASAGEIVTSQFRWEANSRTHSAPGDCNANN